MISRRTALALAEVCARIFYYTYRSPGGYASRTMYAVDTDEFYNFLYAHDYPAWLCNKAKSTTGHSEKLPRATRKLKEFIMKLHTGETQAEATPQWTWEQRELLGQRYLHNLAEDILNWWTEKQNEQARKALATQIKELSSNLSLDGCVYKAPHLLAPESDVLDVKEETGVLESLHEDLALNNKEMAFHHLSLSEEHYLAERWDDSIANSRKFLECVLREVAAAHSLRCKGTQLPDSTYKRPVRVRDYLEREGLLETKEKETIASVYGLLSETGGHPYMARDDQSRLLRHLALTLSQFVMLRLRGSL